MARRKHLVKRISLLSLLSVLFVVSSINAQNSDLTADVILNSLVAGLEMNPDNPVGIDGKFLNELAGTLPQGALKSALSSYGNYLGADKDLSYRQIYSDVHAAFEQNPGILQNPNYQNVGLKMDYLFNSYSTLENILGEANAGNYELGSFVTNPMLISNLSNLTGSYESAMTIGMGMELLSGIIADNAEQERLNEERGKLAKISSEALFAEKDPNMTQGLIDAFLGKTDGGMNSGEGRVTSMYRYDFDNGASLQVQNGILKYINATRGIAKNLCRVSQRYTDDDKVNRVGKTNVIVSENDRYFHVMTQSDKGCEGCLKIGRYIIDASNGDIKSSGNYTLSSPCPSSFNKIGIVKDYLDWTEFGNHQILVYLFGNKEKGLDFKSGKAKFEYNKELKRKVGSISSGVAGEINVYQQSEFLYEKERALGGLFWKNTSSSYWSKLGLIDTTGFQNTDLMHNELTGMVMASDDRLFFVSSKGQLGKLNGNEYTFSSNKLPEQIRAALNPKKVASYDFENNRTYKADHGSNFSTTMPKSKESLLPIFRITPDNRHLIYIVKDSLFLIDPNDLSNVKRFGLSIQPYNGFFTKENANWVLNMVARNDFSFPVMKKYSLEKLSKMDTTPKKKVSAPANANKSIPTTAANSVADELKKLKSLMDEGVLTQEEFNTEKKKLLNVGTANGAAQAFSNRPAAQPAENGSGSGVSEQQNENPVVPKQENVLGKSNSSAFEGEYSKWLFILTDKALQYRFRQIKVVEDSADFEVQFRINFEDKIFCDHPNCLGYTLAFGVPNMDRKDYTYQHFKFFNSFKGVYTLPNPIRLQMKFHDGSYRFLTANGFMYSNSTGDRTGASEPFYTCVDQIDKNPNVSNRCEGARAWRDIFIEEKAITIE